MKNNVPSKPIAVPEDGRLAALQEKIGVGFHEESLLFQALIHSSGAQEAGEPRSASNERLEFLGDAFFDAIIGDKLYDLMPDEDEGRLTKVRAKIVCEEGLYEVASALGIEKMLVTGGSNRKRPISHAMIADAMEAIIGAVYKDQGYEAAKDMVLRLFEKRIEDAMAGRVVADYKSAYQEYRQVSGVQDIEYRLVKEEGPAHDRWFTVEVIAGGEKKAMGEGRSKKDAEQLAAKRALEAERAGR